MTNQPMPVLPHQEPTRAAQNLGTRAAMISWIAPLAAVLLFAIAIQCDGSPLIRVFCVGGIVSWTIGAVSGVIALASMRRYGRNRILSQAVIGLCLALTVFVATGVGAVVWSIGSSIRDLLQGPVTPSQEPVRLAAISVPTTPTSLAWSADGRYLAAGTLESGAGDPSSIFVLDIGKQAIMTTLKMTGSVQIMAFSPDGKSLAVASAGSVNKEPGQLVVFDIRTWAARFTVKAKAPAPSPDGSIAHVRGFNALAWTPGSKTLHAIETDALGRAPEFHSWDVATSTERPTIQIDGPKDASYQSLVLSPDGLTLAVAARSESNHFLIRLFNLERGTQDTLIDDVDKYYMGAQFLGFTVDGKTLGVFNGSTLTWWDAGTGKAANPARPRIASQPAGDCAFTLDCHKWVSTHTMNADYGMIFLTKDQQKQFGTFLELFLGVPRSTEPTDVPAATESTTAPSKTLTWRVVSTCAAFSPDGTKLAGVAEVQNGVAVVLWAVPK